MYSRRDGLATTAQKRIAGTLHFQTGECLPASDTGGDRQEIETSGNRVQMMEGGPKSMKVWLGSGTWGQDGVHPILGRRDGTKEHPGPV